MKQNLTTRFIRGRLISLLQNIDLGDSLRWGFAVWGERVDPDAAYGHVSVITPSERVALTREMVEATRSMKLFTGGQLVTSLALPDMVCDVGPRDALPAVDIHLTHLTRWGSVQIYAQLPWDLVEREPVFVLTRRRIPGWPL